jgi:hypothetical protein
VAHRPAATFVERERKTRRAIAAGERDMLAQHTDESFRADHVRFRTAGAAVVQVLVYMSPLEFESQAGLA